MISIKSINAPAVCADPKVADLILKNTEDKILRQAVTRRVRNERSSVVSADAPVCPKPNESFSILVHARNIVACQSHGSIVCLEDKLLCDCNLLETRRSAEDKTHHGEFILHPGLLKESMPRRMNSNGRLQEGYESLVR